VAAVRTHEPADRGHPPAYAPGRARGRSGPAREGMTMWIAAHAARTHAAVVIIAVVVVVGIIGIWTTHKGNR